MKKIIACIDVLKGKVVKGINFQDPVEIGDPAELGEKYQRDGADEVVFLDITASLEKRETMVEVARKVAGKLSAPFTVGGGIRSLDDIEKVLAAGADKVSINTAAVRSPGLIRQASEKFGSGKIVVAIDARKKGDEWRVVTEGGYTFEKKNPVDWAREAESLGAGEILLTSWEADGTKSGYDLELTREIAEAVSIPVVASGGAGSLESIYEVLTEGKAAGALIASGFHFGMYTAKDVKKYLKEKGVEVDG